MCAGCYSVDRLLTAVQKCQNSSEQHVKKAVASACLKLGFQECQFCYLLKPADFRKICAIIRKEESRAVAWKLMRTLWTKQYEKYFSVIRHDDQDPHVILHLENIISTDNQQSRVQDILDKVHTVTLHPSDAGYEIAVFSHAGKQPETQPAPQAVFFRAEASLGAFAVSCCAIFVKILRAFVHTHAGCIQV